MINFLTNFMSTAGNPDYVAAVIGLLAGLGALLILAIILFIIFTIVIPN